MPRSRNPQDKPDYAEAIGLAIGLLFLPILLIAALAGAMPTGQEVSGPRFARTRSGKVKRWHRKR